VVKRLQHSLARRGPIYWLGWVVSWAAFWFILIVAAGWFLGLFDGGSDPSPTYDPLA
jgi:hypothetical protein